MFVSKTTRSSVVLALDFRPDTMVPSGLTQNVLLLGLGIHRKEGVDELVHLVSHGIPHGSREHGLTSETDNSGRPSGSKHRLARSQYHDWLIELKGGCIRI